MSHHNGGSGIGCIIAVVIGLFLVWAFAGTCLSTSRVTEDEALDRFKELAGTENVVILRHTNLTPIIGDSKDVTFELTVNGKPASGRCTDSLMSPLVCRLYSGPGE